MNDSFSIPPEQLESFRRLYPYIEGQLKNNAKVMEALSFFLKLGGEKLARVAIDAYNETQRINDAEDKKRQREEALLRENREEEEEEEELDGETEKSPDAEGESTDFD